LEGFYEAEIRYNTEKKEWEVFTVGGGCGGKYNRLSGFHPVLVGRKGREQHHGAFRSGSAGVHSGDQRN
jgi:hypothetical protein